MAIRVSVNTAKCQSYQRCMAVAPAVFGIDASSGKAQVLHPVDASQDLIVKAARSCPYRAIAGRTGILSDNPSLSTPTGDVNALGRVYSCRGSTIPPNTRFGSIGSSKPPSSTPVRTITSSLSGNT